MAFIQCPVPTKVCPIRMRIAEAAAMPLSNGFLFQHLAPESHLGQLPVMA